MFNVRGPRGLSLEQQRERRLRSSWERAATKRISRAIIRQGRMAADIFRERRLSGVLAARAQIDSVMAKALVPVVTSVIAEWSKRAWSAMGLISGKAGPPTPQFEFPEIDLPPDINGDVYRMATSRYIDEISTRRIKTITDTAVLQDVRKLVDAADREGWSPDEVATRIQDRARGFSRWKAERIARTEINAAANFGGHTAMRATGQPLDKQWLATNDDRVRPTHRAASGQRQPLEKPFVVGGFEIMFPADPNGPPQETIQCRCTVLYFPARARPGQEPPGPNAQTEALAVLNRVQQLTRRRQLIERIKKTTVTRLEREYQSAVEAYTDKLAEFERAGLPTDSPELVALKQKNREALQRFSTAFDRVERLKTRVKNQIARAIEIPESRRAKVSLTFSGRFTKDMRRRAGEAQRFIESITDKRVFGERGELKVEIHRIRKNARAYALGGTINVAMNDDIWVFVHEMGHLIERQGQNKALERAVAFLKQRGAGETPVRLVDLFPNYGYDESEIAFRDRFLSPYAGKLYPSGKVTELISMGVQWLHGATERFAAEDPEMFVWLLTILRGG